VGLDKWDAEACQLHQYGPVEGGWRRSFRGREEAPSIDEVCPYYKYKFRYNFCLKDVLLPYC
jgi:hypothetical protein